MSLYFGNIQQAIIGYITLSVTNMLFAWDGSILTPTTNDVSITSNINWIINTSDSWITTDIGSGSGNDIFLVYCSVNNLTEPRSGYVTVSGDGITKTISINQEPYQ